MQVRARKVNNRPGDVFLDIYGNRFRISDRESGFLYFIEKEFHCFTASSGLYHFHITEGMIKANSVKGTYLSKDRKSHILLLLISMFLSRKYIILHGSCVVKDGKATLFVGPSGSGKSTTAFLCSTMGFEVFTDDCILISKKDYTVRAFPKPLRLKKDVYNHLVERSLLNGVRRYGRFVYFEPKKDRARLSNIYFLDRKGPALHPVIFMLKNSHTTCLGEPQLLLNAFVRLVTRATRIEYLSKLTYRSFREIQQSYLVLQGLLEGI